MDVLVRRDAWPNNRTVSKQDELGGSTDVDVHRTEKSSVIRHSFIRHSSFPHFSDLQLPLAPFRRQRPYLCRCQLPIVNPQIGQLQTTVPAKNSKLHRSDVG
jgi:hypothetical protein